MLFTLHHFVESAYIYKFITARNASYGKVMFSQVCVKNSVHGAVYPSMQWGGLPRVLRPTPDPEADTLSLPEMTTQVDGTHPTGMHSCTFLS